MPTVPADATWLALAAAAGSCIALQAAANAALKHQLGDARYAAFFSICGTILSAVFFMLIMRPAPPTAAAIRTAPWWNWIGGPLGALIVLAGATLTPKLGAAAFIAAVVGGRQVGVRELDVGDEIGAERVRVPQLAEVVGGEDHAGTPVAVGGQLVCSLTLDHFGLMNVPPQALSASRLLGAVMVFAGVLLVRYG